tara:strand:+ start:1182 stop:1370 length:189 start_codon:yes stop_codon:yes gene_type:complete
LSEREVQLIPLSASVLMQVTLWQLGDIKAEDIMDVNLSSIFDHRDDPQKLLFVIQDDLVLLG